MSRFLVFAFDRPYPANRGGRADIWRRAVALKSLGHQVMMVSWTYGGITSGEENAHELSVIRESIDEYSEHKVRSGKTEFLRRLLLLPWAPSHVSSRILHAEARRMLYERISKFNPDIVWSEGPYPAAEARKAASHFGLPFIYRSHNIEHLYMQRQAMAAHSIRDKIAWLTACIGLRHYEIDCLKSADVAFDISLDDMAWWKSTYDINCLHWLPPLPESLIKRQIDTEIHQPDHDVVFLGNLTTPNNVAGVMWLVSEVWPLVLALRPGTTLLIAGSRPLESIRSLAIESPDITFTFNPPDAIRTYLRGRVLVNPVKTGSGIQLKAVEMLALGLAVVTTQQGVAGMPSDVQQHFSIADEALQFAQSVVSALDRWGTDEPQSLLRKQSAVAHFGLPVLEASIAKLPLTKA